MSQLKSEFREVMRRVCDGSDDAVWEFIETYGPHIQQVIRKRLNPRLRSKFDSIDFVQMVWASFFTDPTTIRRFCEPEDLIRYLVALARNKVIDESRRRLRCQGRDVRRERSLDAVATTPMDPHSNQPTPSQIAIARERYHTIMSREPERNRRIVQLRISGASIDEIGHALGIHERTVRKVISKLAGTRAWQSVRDTSLDDSSVV